MYRIVCLLYITLSTSLLLADCCMPDYFFPCYACPQYCPYLPEAKPRPPPFKKRFGLKAPIGALPEEEEAAAAAPAFAAKTIPRTVVAFYDSSLEKDLFFTYIHQFAEMPLNHLGIKLVYHDINAELPQIADKEEILGVITWFPQGLKMKAADNYLRWAIKAIDAGKKFAILGDPGFYAPGISFDQINLFLKRLGVHDSGNAISFTYDVEFALIDPKMMNFERKYKGIIPGFSSINSINVIQEGVKTHLLVRKRGKSLCNPVWS